MKLLEKKMAYLFAALLAVVSMSAWAAGAADREFNHMTTGFPLMGIHATTACESCHVGGVFAGTPRTCDGCHAVGKRIVATPKSTKHIVTDAPCETCHFNASTFYGARYNHGTAVPGQCESCHNGRISAGRPSNHTGAMLLYTCDNCHRTSSWLPASWNHRDTSSDCSQCHYNHTLGNGRTPSASHLPMAMGAVNFANSCKSCHNNYYTFTSAFYNHAGAGVACQNCHGPVGSALGGAATYTGVKAASTTGIQSVHTAIGAAPFATANCQSCHRSYSTFLGAKFDHAGAAAAGCASCHVTPASNYGGLLTLMSTAAGNIHPAATTVGIITGAGATATGCSSCHSMSNFAAWTGAYSHADAAYTAKMAVNSCAGCHNGTALPIKAIPVNHTNAFTAGLVTTPSGPGSCNACHTTFSAWTQMNHGALTMVGGCKACHDSGLNPGLYFANMQRKSNGHKGYNNTTQDCTSCHTRNIGNYTRWYD